MRAGPAGAAECPPVETQFIASPLVKTQYIASPHGGPAGPKIKKPQPKTTAVFVVPRTGLEPAQYYYH